MSELPPSPFLHDLETAVREHHGAAAREREEALCCPPSYDLAHAPSSRSIIDDGHTLRRGVRTAGTDYRVTTEARAPSCDPTTGRCC